ncbi:HEPN domain-containing protein [Sinisalibacter lacisalsi]|uniref:RiboL-PSP-HEPN domain-containing protein n=1 Tax=Sinisalibacter lacisalsi TaxID=1526570 RepID=A0ABQ1QQV9_9RHOB|nr:HEPN domain-containing protein [Sinisalibacter lacisalsi]GGD38951.1 hypothetical protein GCM10011358_23580 [Sinisalibacter lacisalsi]
MILGKTTKITELAKEAVDAIPETNPSARAFVETAFAGYISAIAYSEIEAEVSRALENRYDKSTDSGLASFVRSVFNRNAGRLKRSELADLVSFFGQHAKDKFKSEISDAEVQLYSRLLQCRHNLAHGDPPSETLNQMELGINSAKNILEKLQICISED